jgi:hypothetical protein
MTTTPDAAGPNDVTVSLEQMLADMERAEFEKWVRPDSVQRQRQPDTGEYIDRGMAAAWAGWQARGKLYKPCRGVRHPNCEYLAPCGSICNKCGQAT